MEDLYAKAVQELAEIDVKLAEMAALQKRREQLRPFVEMGRGLFSESGTITPLTGNLFLRAAQADDMFHGGVILRRRLTTKDRIIGLAAQVISKRGPTSTADIIKELEVAGVEIGSDNKVLAVSSVLSREKSKFKSDRAAGGWVLIHPHEEETPQGAPTPAGS